MRNHDITTTYPCHACGIPVPAGTVVLAIYPCEHFYDRYDNPRYQAARDEEERRLENERKRRTVENA
jgi:hypothetical protein